MAAAAVDIPPWLETLAPAAVVLLAGAGLLALGVLRKDRAMVALAVVGLAVVAVVAAMVLRRQVPAVFRGRSTLPSASDAFARCAGVRPPRGVVQRSAVHIHDAQGNTEYSARIETPRDFGGFLRRHFRPCTWEEAAPAMMAPHLALANQPPRTWRPDDLPDARCYRRDWTGPDGITYDSFVVYDADSRTAYFVARPGAARPKE